MKLLGFLLAPLFWLFRKVAKLTIILAIILLIVLASGNYWLPWVAKWQIKSRTGFGADVESSVGSLFRGCVNFHNFSISNPKDAFESHRFITFNEMATDVRLRSMLTGKIVLENVVLDIGSVTLVKNVNGMYNLQLFAKNISGMNRETPSIKTDGNKFSDQNAFREKISPKIHLSKVTFAIGSVKVIDEADRGNAKEYSLNYRREFTNIDDIDSIIKPLVADLSKYGLSIFVQTAFDSVLHIPGLEKIAEGIIKVKDVSKDVVKDVEGGIKGLFKKGNFTKKSK
ncbi:MAG: AsmA family protein [Puniceicoccales bacterium]|nr:AsmA family protein [Puniceicoccales bacterium]